MAGIGEIRNPLPIRQSPETRAINPANGKQQMPRRQPRKDQNEQHEDDQRDDPFHIDEYA